MPEGRPKTVRFVFENISGSPTFHLPRFVRDVSAQTQGSFLDSEQIEFVFRNSGGSPVFYVDGARLPSDVAEDELQYELEGRPEENIKNEARAIKMESIVKKEEPVEEGVNHVDLDHEEGGTPLRNHTTTQEVQISEVAVTKSSTSDSEIQRQTPIDQDCLRKDLVDPQSPTTSLVARGQKRIHETGPGAENHTVDDLSNRNLKRKGSHIQAVLKSSIPRPMNTTVRRTRYNGIEYETWSVSPRGLTEAEIAWLVSQEDLKKVSGTEKPVEWAALAFRMFYESEKRMSQAFRPLHYSILGLAWDANVWRFPGQSTEFPIFNKDLKWLKWRQSEEGQKWVQSRQK